MADTKVSALAAATPIGTDVVYLVDDAVGTPVSKKATVDALLGVTQGTYKNALDADTGVTGDGVTDDASALATLLSAGGAFYFPPAEYHLGGTVGVVQTDHLDVLCAAGAIFQTDGEAIDADLFDITTNVTNDDLVRFSWIGGTINGEGVMNSTSLGAGEQVGGFLNVGTVSTTSIFDLRDGYWESVYIDGVNLFNRTNGHITDPYDNAQHHQGDLTNGYTPGADSGITINSGPGPVTIRNCNIVGFKDAAVYVSGQGNSAATPPGWTIVDNVNAFYCSDGIAFKQETTRGGVISNSMAYNCGKGFFLGTAAATEGSRNTIVSNCVAERCKRSFVARETERTQFVNCHSVDTGLWTDWSGDMRGCVGSVTIDAAATGDGDTITGITVNSIQVMSGTVTQSGAGNDDVFVKAVASNINAHTSSPDYKAGAWNDGTDWIVYITSTAGDSDTFAVASAGTASTTDAAMAYIVSDANDAMAVEIEGCLDLDVIGLKTSAQLASLITAGIQRASLVTRGFEVQSSSDIQSLDVHIKGATLNGLGTVGGERTGGTATADRTKVAGLTVGLAVADATGFTLEGGESWCEYLDRGRVVLSSNYTQATNTYTTVAKMEGLRADAVYRLTGELVMYGTNTDDLETQWLSPPANTGWYNFLAMQAGDVQPGGGTGQWAQLDTKAYDFSDNQDIGVGSSGSNKQVVTLRGIFSPTADGDLDLQMRTLNATPTGTQTIVAGSWIGYERVS